MKLAVADTSALIRLFVPDGPIPPGFEAFVESAWRADALLLAPELALAEAGQVLHRKVQQGLLQSDQADEILEAILDLPLEFIGHRELIPAAIKVAQSHRCTVYDALFVALAIARGGSLFTADEALANAFRAPRPRQRPG